MNYVFPPRRILVPTDLKATSLPAFHFARVVHSQFSGSVHVMHATHFDPPPYFSSSQIRDLKQEFKKAAKSANDYVRKESLGLLGFEPDTHIVENSPVEGILETSRALEADLIIMGTHGRHGADRLWLGSVAEQILHRSPKPILAVRQGMTAVPFGHILCPVSFSPIGRSALQYAASIAAAGRLRLTVLHSLEPGAAHPDCELVPDIIRSLCTIEEVTQQGDAAASIIKSSQELKPDLIVMGAERKHSDLLIPRKLS
jgi:nucleotide-binding universal stress UspA family protein